MCLSCVYHVSSGEGYRCVAPSRQEFATEELSRGQVMDITTEESHVYSMNRFYLDRPPFAIANDSPLVNLLTGKSGG